MTSDTIIRRLTARLRAARWRVRRLGLLLLLAERAAVARCDHEWDKEYPAARATMASIGTAAASAA